MEEAQSSQESTLRLWPASKRKERQEEIGKVTPLFVIENLCLLVTRLKGMRHGRRKMCSNTKEAFSAVKSPWLYGTQSLGEEMDVPF